jgi:hypothetical protein
VSALLRSLPGVASSLFTYSIRYGRLSHLVVSIYMLSARTAHPFHFPFRHAMPPQSLASLLLARQEVDSALKRLKLDSVAERKRKKVEEGKDTASNFSASSKKVALILYVLAGYVGSEAAAFLWERKHKRSKHVRSVVGHYAAVVEDWFLALSDEAVGQLGSVTVEQGCACSRKAYAFHEQWQLKDWVARENATKGIAPRSELILLRLRDLRLESGRAQHSYERGGNLPRSSAAKMYMVRFRHRMRMKLGALIVREPIEMTEIRLKA